ncbi:MAG: type II toxin-antitoxin system HicA family toxin [Theionarchaea archaeon]|nr:type II toxin-antitoxin system HicA family toxin [Theionarchaea archaeon]
MNKQQLFEELKKNPKNVRFEKLCKAAEVFGFTFRGGSGSHRIYVREGVEELLNFQNVKGKAKPHQVRQPTKIIEKYSLLQEDRENV